MKTYDYCNCPSCCEGSLCSDCASLETLSVRDDLQEITGNERTCMPCGSFESVTRYVPVGGDDNSVLSRSNPMPRAVPRSEQDLTGGQPSHGGVTRTEGDHPPVGTTVKVVAKCRAMTKMGRHCADAALPLSEYCFNHLPIVRAASINTVNSRIVRCCGKTNKGKQCKDTAKAGSLYCGKHSETATAHTTGGKMSYQCRCLTERGTQCPNTAKTGSLYCGMHSSPPTVPDASRKVISRCRGLTYRGSRCLDTAKAGSEYCGKHSHEPRAPPGGKILGRCSGRNKHGERCKDIARSGTLYCRNHTAPVTTQSAKTDNTKVPQGGDILGRCTGRNKHGERCKDTARSGALCCRNHTAPVTTQSAKTDNTKAPSSGDILGRCSGRNKHGERCKDTARGGALYCRNHTAPVVTQSVKTDNTKAPPGGNILGRCSGRNKHGERCKDTARSGTLYCSNHTAPVTQSAKTDNVQIPVKEPERQQCDARVGPFVDRSHPDLHEEDPCSDTVNKQMRASSEVSKKLIDKNGGTMDLRHPDLQENHCSDKVQKPVTTNSQAPKKSVDKNGCAMDAHGHNGKASKAFAADSPDLREDTDPLGRIARLHIPRNLELQNLLKAWIVACREGSRKPISGNLVLRGPQGKFPLLKYFGPV
jgi:hypothetical protein